MKAMNGSNLGYLVAICAECHKFIEFKDGRKVMLTKANSRLRHKPLTEGLRPERNGPC